MRSLKAVFVLLLAVGSSGYLAPREGPRPEEKATGTISGDCCACEAIFSPDKHWCKADKEWIPNDPPIETDWVAGECEPHGHGMSCEIDPDSPEPDMDDFLVAIAQRDLDGIHAILRDPNSRIVFNAERHAVQQLDCQGEAYVSHVLLDEEEFTVVGQALNDAL